MTLDEMKGADFTAIPTEELKKWHDTYRHFSSCKPMCDRIKDELEKRK